MATSSKPWRYVNLFEGRIEDDAWMTDKELAAEREEFRFARAYITVLDLPRLFIARYDAFDSIHIYIHKDLIE